LNAVLGARWTGALHRASGSSLLRDAAGTYASRIVVVFAGLAMTVVVARTLGPEGRGLYASAAAVAAIGVQLGSLGLHSANAYQVARDRSLLPVLIGNSLGVSIAFGSAIAFGGWVLYSVLGPATNGTVWAVALATIPIGLALLLLQHLLLGSGEIRAYNAIELGTRLAGVGTVTALFAAGLVSVEAYLAAAAGVFAMGLVASGRRLLAAASGRVKASAPVLGKLLRYGLKAWTASFFAFLLLRIDLLQVQSMLGSQSAGYYSVAVALADMLYLLPAAVGLVLFPRLAAMTDRSAKLALVRTTGGAIIVAMLVLAGLSVVAGEAAITLLFGEEFTAAASAFAILSVGMVFYGVNNVVSSYLAAEGFPMVSVVVWIAAVLFVIPANVVLIPELGVEGAAWTSVAGYAMVLGVQTLYMAWKDPARAS
jgi:O-antigen/teichoic acid export membrane protein